MNNPISSTDNNSTEKTKVRKKFPKKMFTVTEDATIIQCVSLYGTNNWKLISQFLPGRTIRQLRERYNTYLKPGTLDTPWTPEEDLLLSQKVKEYGKHWKAISQFFKGRNQNNIKNRWNFHLKGGAALKTNINENNNNEKTCNNNINSDIKIDNNNSMKNINNDNEININITKGIKNDHNSNDHSNNYIIATDNKIINTKDFKNDEFDFGNTNNSDTSKNTNNIGNSILNNNINNKITEISSGFIQTPGNSNNNHQSSTPLSNTNTNSIKENKQQINCSQIQSNPMSEVFNDIEYDLYCSNVFTNFQYDPTNSSQNSELLQIKKIE